MVAKQIAALLFPGPPPSPDLFALKYLALSQLHPSLEPPSCSLVHFKSEPNSSPGAPGSVSSYPCETSPLHFFFSALHLQAVASAPYSATHLTVTMLGVPTWLESPLKEGI